MSDLKSWNIVTLDGIPEGLVVDELPTFDLFDGDPWGVEFVLDPETREWGTEPVGASLSGWFHATPFAIGEWAKEFTAAHAGTTITWYEEFRMDDVGEGSNVYRGGELITAESTVSQMVPLDLPNMLNEAKAMLASYDAAEATDYDRLAEALRSLVEGLS